MGDFNCITVGINRYQFLQPLAYAQNDATSIADALVNYGKIKREQVLVLGDDVPWVEHRSTVPTKENIQGWLEYNQEHQTPHRILWFFFSGYGVSVQGQDYLMLTDSDPRNLATAMTAKELFQLLKQQGAEQIVAIFDVNRSPGVQGTNPVGENMVNLAKDMGIVTILSTEPDQYSHEAPSLGHGLFTAALLEAINHHREELTLRHIDRYLKTYLAELSEHHWRPLQHPLIVTPHTQFASVKLLGALDDDVSSVAVGERTLVGVGGATAAGLGLKLPRFPASGAVNSFEEEELLGLDLSSDDQEEAPELQAFNENDGLLEEEQQQLEQLNHGTKISTTSVTLPVNKKGVTSTSTRSKSKNSGCHNQLMIAAIGLFLFGLLSSSLMKLFNGDNPTTTTTGGSSTSEPQNGVDNVSSSTGGDPNPANSSTAPTNGNGSSSLNSSDSDVNSSSAGANNGKPLIKDGGYRDRARVKLRATQAHRFYDAIKEAQQVKADNPDFAQAQQDIDRWSKVIIDISEGRVAGGDLPGGIAAGQLFESNFPAGYAAAQENLKRLKEAKGYGQVNFMIITAAKKQVIKHQASSYNKAIRTLSNIKPNEPQYQAAQNLVSNWSREIYLIANSRAAKKHFPNAIAAAKLVPQGTDYYDRAQGAIQRWSKGSNE